MHFYMQTSYRHGAFHIEFQMGRAREFNICSPNIFPTINIVRKFFRHNFRGTPYHFYATRKTFPGTQLFHARFSKRRKALGSYVRKTSKLYIDMRNKSKSFDISNCCRCHIVYFFCFS